MGIGASFFAVVVVAYSLPTVVDRGNNEFLNQGRATSPWLGSVGSCTESHLTHNTLFLIAKANF